MKKIIYILLLLPTTVFAQSEISEYLFGQNAWMPDSIGNTRYYGKLDELWQKVGESKVKLIRAGGIAYDNHKMTNQQFLNLIDSIRNIGAEPLIQVPWSNGTYTSTEAASLVNFINIQQSRNVKFWSISNEPDLSFGSDAAIISTYFKNFASAMKQQDSSIKIVGPDLAWYNTSIMDSLLGGTNDITGTDVNGNYYLDIISLHMYLFDGTQTTRSEVITRIENHVVPTVENLIARMQYADNLHARGTDSLRWAFTEFNIDYHNPDTNDLQGLGASSFINGQIWAQIFGLGMEYNAIFICPWSIHESAGSSSSSDLGYISGNSSVTYRYRPSFYHEQLLSNNTKVYFENYTSNIPEVKTFGSYDNGLYTVVILNMAQQAYEYEIFNNVSSTSTKPLVIKATTINLPNSFIDSIQAECTQLLVFNNQGEILYKYSYCLDDAILNLPPTKTTFSTVGINDLKSVKLSIYPNPSKEYIAVECEILNGENQAEIQLYTIDGQLINSYKIDKTIETLRISTGKLSNGIYIINITTKNGITKVKKFIVNR